MVVQLTIERNRDFAVALEGLVGNDGRDGLGELVILLTTFLNTKILLTELEVLDGIRYPSKQTLRLDQRCT